MQSHLQPSSPRLVADRRCGDAAGAVGSGAIDTAAAETSADHRYNGAVCITARAVYRATE